MTIKLLLSMVKKSKLLQPLKVAYPQSHYSKAYFVKNDQTGKWELLHEHSSSAIPNHDD